MPVLRARLVVFYFTFSCSIRVFHKFVKHEIKNTKKKKTVATCLSVLQRAWCCGCWWCKITKLSEEAKCTSLFCSFYLIQSLVCAESMPVKCDNQILISFFLEKWRNQNTAKRKRPRFLIEVVSNNEAIQALKWIIKLDKFELTADDNFRVSSLLK